MRCIRLVIYRNHCELLPNHVVVVLVVQHSHHHIYLRMRILGGSHQRSFVRFRMRARLGGGRTPLRAISAELETAVRIDRVCQLFTQNFFR